MSGPPVDDLHPHGPLGNEAGHEQRNDRSRHAPDQAEDRQRGHVKAGRSDVVADAQHAEHDGNDQDNGEVRSDEEKNALGHDVYRIRPVTGSRFLRPFQESDIV